MDVDFIIVLEILLFAQVTRKGDPPYTWSDNTENVVVISKEWDGPVIVKVVTPDGISNNVWYNPNQYVKRIDFQQNPKG